jgi:hypothetical protein
MVAADMSAAGRLLFGLRLDPDAIEKARIKVHDSDIMRLFGVAASASRG